LAIAYLDHPAIADARDVVIVVCGGVSINAQLVARWARLSSDTHAGQGRKRYQAITSPTTRDDDLQ
jgi:L-serine/L-threonine ammonia-lyase